MKCCGLCPVFQTPPPSFFPDNYVQKIFEDLLGYVSLYNEIKKPVYFILSPEFCGKEFEVFSVEFNKIFNDKDNFKLFKWTFDKNKNLITSFQNFDISLILIGLIGMVFL
jgi:hypothetical protein